MIRLARVLWAARHIRTCLQGSHDWRYNPQRRYGRSEHYAACRRCGRKWWQ